MLDPSFLVGLDPSFLVGLDPGFLVGLDPSFLEGFGPGFLVGLDQGFFLGGPDSRFRKSQLDPKLFFISGPGRYGLFPQRAAALISLFVRLYVGRSVYKSV